MSDLVLTSTIDVITRECEDFIVFRLRTSEWAWLTLVSNPNEIFEVHFVDPAPVNLNALPKIIISCVGLLFKEFSGYTGAETNLKTAAAVGIISKYSELAA